MPFAYLALAILAEVVGTSALKASNGFTLWAPSAVVIASRSVVKASTVLLSASESTVIVASTRRDSRSSPAGREWRPVDRRTSFRRGTGPPRRPGKKLVKTSRFSMGRHAAAGESPAGKDSPER